MDESPKNERDSEDEAMDRAADAEFERVLRNLVNTPHKPHAPAKSPPGKAAPTDGSD
ncbi:hypothetical protein HZ989_05975 [Brevundimonas sp. AJA228-03]|uniref:hypothetical protein n=1 Tax=Brevundimonas sp. AJA228-03 TaxID=2752515 RepID=UPI001AE08C1E|nr:hypothetical protein [Brevundimonas sp. AJA228-03]QTN20599.1 hypothetical protein HZ989_05975 [Brevundimonas sp. AJA228-03]